MKYSVSCQAGAALRAEHHNGLVFAAKDLRGGNDVAQCRDLCFALLVGVITAGND